MNINKVISIGMMLFIFLVPFRYIFLDDTRIISTGPQMLIFLASLIGFLIAFGIGTNQPFGRKKESVADTHSSEQSHRKAA